MKQKIEQTKLEFDKKYANILSEEQLEELRVDTLGKKGSITLLMPLLKEVPNEQKKEFGMLINELKNYCTNKILELAAKFDDQKLKKQIESGKKYDFTLPSDCKVGSLHPRTITQKQVEDIFVSMGFAIEDGKEVVSEFDCFDAVNVPASHPARDMQDTFWLTTGEVLKTHTSAMQNKILKKYGSPCRVIFPGRCFRNEAVDNKHEHTFFQVEGVVVDENVSVANLVFFIKELLSKVYGKELDVRLRPGYFPFVEPGFEMDVKCPFCDGKGCSTCGDGWLELCPCGMIHPNVLKLAGLDSKKVSGFAFGLGFDRLAMIAGKIPDIRLLTSGNIKYLKTFGLNGK